MAKLFKNKFYTRNLRRQSSVNKSLNWQGFTLVELLIAVTMFAFVLLLIATAFIQINRSYSRGVSNKRVHEETRSVMETMSRDLRTASSSNRVVTDCGGDDCVDDDAATLKLCVDDQVYIFTPPDSGSQGRLDYAENVDCDTASAGDGSNMFSDLVQPQFFKVKEIVPDKTYLIEMVVSTGSYSDDLLEEDQDNPRRLGCNTVLPGNQFCRAIYLDTTVTLRN